MGGEEGVEGRRETVRKKRGGKKETKEGTCMRVGERKGWREGERKGEGKRRREGGRKRYRKIQYREDKAYPFSVGASEGSAVGHTSSRHKHIACNIADLILKFLRGAGERKRSKN